MLGHLVEYARRNELDPEPGFKPKSVRWAIAADRQGNYVGVVELGQVEAKRNPGHLFPKCPDLSHGELVSGGETRAHFLVDSAQTVTLYGEDFEPGKAGAKHRYFVSTLEQAGSDIPELLLFACLLADPETLQHIREDLARNKARPADKVTLLLDGEFIVESTTWHDWWRNRRRALAGADKTDAVAAPAVCMATGLLAPAVPTHPKIEGLSGVGGLSTGDVLIGFDKEAFCSYGLIQSANAAVSEYGAAAYRSALNDLIRRRGERLAGTMVVHWFSKRIPESDDPVGWLEQSMEQQALEADSLASRFLRSVRLGDRTEVADNHYYVLTLSGASGRVMVRDWAEGQFRDLAENIARWFDDLAIVNRSGDGLAPYPKFMAVAGSLVRDLGDLSSSTVAELWRVALKGNPIPLTALAEAQRRAAVDLVKDEPANHARYGLMKAFHVRNERKKGVGVADQSLGYKLNESHPSPAYQCGRLMAVLAALQRAALGDVGAGLVQRYYAAASATPALVLGRLTRTSQFHLGKLQPGLAYWYESRIADIWARLGDGVPNTLTLEQQSLFSLGYYQQMAAMRAERHAGNGEE
jgi:CRISPR-associated protein Csd1